jgi:hypothetical protein
MRTQLISGSNGSVILDEDGHIRIEGQDIEMKTEEGRLTITTPSESITARFNEDGGHELFVNETSQGTTSNQLLQGYLRSIRETAVLSEEQVERIITNQQRKARYWQWFGLILAGISIIIGLITLRTHGVI